MPSLTIDDYEVVEVEPGTRLLSALIDAGVDILHRCGGYARCTTCRVEFIEGEPNRMTVAERDKLIANEQLGEFRLSCQCLVNVDMHVKPLLSFEGSGLDDAGPMPEAFITPEPEWITEGDSESGDSEIGTGALTDDLKD